MPTYSPPRGHPEHMPAYSPPRGHPEHMPVYSPPRGRPEHNTQACTASPSLPGLCLLSEVPHELLHLAPGLTRVWLRPFEASLLGTRWQGVPGLEVGTSPKGLLPQVTQCPAWLIQLSIRLVVQRSRHLGHVRSPTLSPNMSTSRVSSDPDTPIRGGCCVGARRRMVSALRRQV